MITNIKMSVQDIDALQKYITTELAYNNAKNTLNEYNISDIYIKGYLVSELFYKFPDFYPNMPDELKSQISNVYNKINLKENIQIYDILLKKWKQDDLSEMILDIEDMKDRTRSSSMETDNENCKSCYNTQEDILNTAQKILKRFN